MLQGRIFVTGGAGFLARALYRRATRENWPATFTCFSRDDAKHVALRRRYPNIHCIRGDVAGDRDVLAGAMRGHELVIHAAAVKYVDLAETAVFDTVRVNVHGSENVAMAAISAQVRRVIGISTDKAALPVNVYGMTKAVMERILVEADRLETETEFTVCRYGNVVGSTGSVIPMFKRQYQESGQVTVTDPAMTRFWMAADAAIDTIIEAARCKRGSTVIPVPQAASMRTVLEACGIPTTMARVVGLRPGEKIHELLIHEQESVRCYQNGYGYWELRPPGEVHGKQQFSLSSENAISLTAEELAAFIADSEGI